MNSTNMWVLTNGLDGGISKIVGDAVRYERERRFILSARGKDVYVKLPKKEEVAELPKLTVMGIVPKLKVENSVSLDEMVRTSWTEWYQHFHCSYILLPTSSFNAAYVPFFCKPILLGCGHICYFVKMHYQVFLLNPLLDSMENSGKLKVVIMRSKCSTKIVNIIVNDLHETTILLYLMFFL